eukprot:TRINITY_DN4002_c0_g1_i1.p1 TRINITY_DN4002_c0_g1~~TRINITY_DN4002_c0_g1_i1.p1  ORF type:complete len:366 (+),score=83.17 TRINITY_DN4002_c0_g1_i1:42-1100(+)
MLATTTITTRSIPSLLTLSRRGTSLVSTVSCTEKGLIIGHHNNVFNRFVRNTTSTVFYSTATETSESSQSIAKARAKAEAKIGGIKQDGSTRRWYQKVEVMNIHDYLATEEGSKSGASGFTLKTGQGKDEWVVLLDGRALRTPKNNRFVIPSRVLALAIAAEWDAQKEKIQPKRMPLMSIATTAIDHLPETRMTVIGNLLMLLGADTLLYRAHESEKGLKELQEKLHDPILKWFQETHNCRVALIPEGSFKTVPQPEDTISKLRWFLHSQDEWSLASLDVVANQAKSLILALALQSGAITSKEAVLASRAEEDHQITQWGEVMAGHDLDKVGATINISSASTFIKLLKLKTA